MWGGGQITAVFKVKYGLETEDSVVDVSRQMQEKTLASLRSISIVSVLRPHFR
jgi:hypothetical protein